VLLTECDVVWKRGNTSPDDKQQRPDWPNLASIRVLPLPAVAWKRLWTRSAASNRQLRHLDVSDDAILSVRRGTGGLGYRSHKGGWWFAPSYRNGLRPIAVHWISSMSIGWSYRPNAGHLSATNGMSLFTIGAWYGSIFLIELQQGERGNGWRSL